MRSHKFINILLCLVIQLVAKESKAKENKARVRRLFVLFIDKRYISQVIHFKLDINISTIGLFRNFQYLFKVTALYVFQHI